MLLHYPNQGRQASHIIDLEHPLRPATFSLHQLPTLYCPWRTAIRKRNGALCGIVRCTDHLRAIEPLQPGERATRSEEHTSELQSLMRISYAVFCLKKKKKH